MNQAVSVGRQGRKDVRMTAVAGDPFAEDPLGVPGVEPIGERKGRRERPGNRDGRANFEPYGCPDHPR